MNKNSELLACFNEYGKPREPKTRKEVLTEPKQAHLGGEKGYEIIEKFLKQSIKLKPQAIFLEFHYEYKDELKK
jgi:methylase of polypeptide subunit release factors